MRRRNILIPHHITRWVIGGFTLGLLLSFASHTESHAQSPHPRDLRPLIESELFVAFAGQTMYGIYKTPTERTGTNTFIESFRADGTSLYQEGDIRDTGYWQVYGDEICFEYDGTFSGEVSCFAVFRAGTCYYSYAPRNVRNGKPISPNAWSVKTKTDDDLSTCDDLTS